MGLKQPTGAIRRDVRNYQNSVKRADDTLGAIMAALDPGHLDFTSAITFDGVKQEPKTCWQWRLEDERLDKPMEFFPRYMHCLAEFGLAQEKRIAAFAEAEPR